MTGLADSLEADHAADPSALTIVVAEAGDDVVCAAWVRFARDTEFATLWGGGTLPEWRWRGIYRAIVAYRANLAAQRGYRYLQVDASDNSRPILERLGFVAVTPRHRSSLVAVSMKPEEWDWTRLVVDHLDLHGRDVRRSVLFYETALTPLGIPKLYEREGEARPP